MNRHRKYSVRQIKTRWYVYAYISGKQVYFPPKTGMKSYATEKDAKAAAKQLSANDRNFLLRDLNANERAEYWRLRGICDKHLISLENAVLKGCGIASHWPYLIRDGYERFIDYCQKSRRLRPRSIGFYRDMNSVLFKKLENAKFGDFDERAIRDLIKSKGNGQEWEKGALRFISALWNWGSRQTPKLSPYGITRGVDLGHSKRQRSIGFLTLDESQRLLSASRGTDIQPCMALMLLTGMRKSEVEGMRWEWFDFDERKIWVPEHVGKTGGRLIARAPDSLWTWLKPGKGPMVAPVRDISHRIQDLRKVAGVEFWCQSACRKTFFTHHYAAHGDADWTKEIAGHEEKSNLFVQRYKGVIAHRENGDYLPTQANGLAYLGMVKDY